MYKVRVKGQVNLEHMDHFNRATRENSAGTRETDANTIRCGLPQAENALAESHRRQ